jgi:hypothetical protein
MDSSRLLDKSLQDELSERFHAELLLPVGHESQAWVNLIRDFIPVTSRQGEYWSCNP